MTELSKPVLDEALIALFIGAMNANDHVAREELARAHHLIWSTRRFRRKSGETVGRLIDRMKRLLEEQEHSAVMEAAARAIPAKLRPSAFAIVADLLLADGKIDARGRKVLHRLPSTSTSGLAWRATSSRPCSSRITCEGDAHRGSGRRHRVPCRAVRARYGDGRADRHTQRHRLFSGRLCLQIEASRPVRLLDPLAFAS